MLGVALVACADVGTGVQWHVPPAPDGATTLVSGTGFFVSADGTLLTARHVIDACRRVDIASDRIPSTTVDVISSDARTDLATLRASWVRPPDILGLGHPPGPSARLTAFGYPAEGALSLRRASPVLANARVIAGNGRDASIILWLEDDRIQHGWSGGPVIDEAGQVVGVVLFVITDRTSVRKVVAEPHAGLGVAGGVVSIRSALAATSVRAVPATREPSAAIVRVFCWR